MIPCSQTATLRRAWQPDARRLTCEVGPACTPHRTAPDEGESGVDPSGRTKAWPPKAIREKSCAAVRVTLTAPLVNSIPLPGALTDAFHTAQLANKDYHVMACTKIGRSQKWGKKTE